MDGRTIRNFGSERKVALLGCVCGEVACWPLLVRVAVDAAAVTWSDFEEPYRKGFDYEPLGSLSFSREQYDAAVDDAERQFAEKANDPPGWREDWREAKLRQLRALDRMLAALAIKHELQDIPTADARQLQYEDPPTLRGNDRERTDTDASDAGSGARAFDQSRTSRALVYEAADPAGRNQRRTRSS